MHLFAGPIPQRQEQHKHHHAHTNEKMVLVVQVGNEAVILVSLIIKFSVEGLGGINEETLLVVYQEGVLIPGEEEAVVGIRGLVHPPQALHGNGGVSGFFDYVKSTPYLMWIFLY